MLAVFFVGEVIFVDTNTIFTFVLIRLSELRVLEYVSFTHVSSRFVKIRRFLEFRANCN